MMKLGVCILSAYLPISVRIGFPLCTYVKCFPIRLSAPILIRQIRKSSFRHQRLPTHFHVHRCIYLYPRISSWPLPNFAVCRLYQIRIPGPKQLISSSHDSKIFSADGFRLDRSSL